MKLTLSLWKLYDTLGFSVNPFNLILSFVSSVFRVIVCHRFRIEAECVGKNVAIEHVAGDKDRTSC